MMFLSIGIGLTIAIVAILVVSWLTSAKSANAPSGALPQSALVGTTIKPFSLPELTGGTLRAPWASGHPAVVIFFASWCGPCQHEMPEVAAYLRAHPTGGVHVMGIDVNDSNGPALKMVKKDGVPFRVGVDPNFAITAGLFKFGQIPETVFVTARGVVTQVYFGAIPPTQLAAGIARLAA